MNERREKIPKVEDLVLYDSCGCEAGYAEYTGRAWGATPGRYTKCEVKCGHCAHRWAESFD